MFSLTTLRKASFLALGAVFAAPAFAQEADDSSPRGLDVEEVVVTAEKREKTLQDTPISVSAFDAAGLTRQSIDSVSDIQLNTPNLSFSKSNFTGANISVRGIGNLCVAASCDAAVGVHLNFASVPTFRVFENEFFDIARVEVLRGPQGTLFGRNTSAGVINIVTQSPTDDFEGDWKVELGSYNAKKASFVLNTPFGSSDIVSNRLAVYKHQRDGIITNEYAVDVANGTNGATDFLGFGLPEKIDDRDISAFRNTLNFNLGDRGYVRVLYSYFKEDDTRARVQNQGCTKDTEGVLGCVSDSRLGFEYQNTGATLANIWTSNWAPGILGDGNIPYPGLTNIGQDGFTSSRPNDLRSVRTDVTPRYFVEERIKQVEFSFQFDSGWNLYANYTDYDNTNAGINDYDWGVPDVPFNVVPEYAILGGLYSTPNFAPDRDGDGDGDLTVYLGPLSAAQNQQLADTINFYQNMPTIYGIDGQMITADRPVGYDESGGVNEVQYAEFRVSTSFDGWINFQFGLNYSEGQTNNIYSVYYNALSAFFQGGLGPATQLGAGQAPNTFLNYAGSYFQSASIVDAESTALFGELYLDLGEKSRLTIGLRMTDEEKFVQTPMGSNGLTTSYLGSGFATCCVEQQNDWQVTTGRVVWDVAFTQNHLGYVGFSRGYKGGGFNPPVPDALRDTLNVPVAFEPEFVDALEFGLKSRFLDNTLQLNWSVFYYDFRDLQVSKIVSRTSINENIDSTNYGGELELIYLPFDEFRVDFTFSYLKTEVGDFSSVDPANPSAGVANVSVCKDLSQAFFYVATNGLPCNVIPGLSPDNALYGHFGALSNPALVGAATAANYIADGLETTVTGNELPNSPEWTYKIGVQYNIDLPVRFYSRLSIRLDFYKQSSFYGRVFNTESDFIEGWDQANLNIVWGPDDGRWEVRGTILNIFDEDSITGTYLTDASSGNFTNLFLLDPRTVALSFRMDF